VRQVGERKSDGKRKIKKKKILMGKTTIDVYCQKLDVKSILKREKEIRESKEITS